MSSRWSCLHGVCGSLCVCVCVRGQLTVLCFVCAAVESDSWLRVAAAGFGFVQFLFFVFV